MKNLIFAVVWLLVSNGWAQDQLSPSERDSLVGALNSKLMENEYEGVPEMLNILIAADPENSTYYYINGFVRDGLGKVDTAIESYEKAIALEPDFFDALYNLGALHYNQSVKASRELMSIKDPDDYLAKQAEQKMWMEKALISLEKAEKLKPDDKNVLMALQQIYAETDNSEGYRRVKVKLAQ